MIKDGENLPCDKKYPVAHELKHFVYAEVVQSKAQFIQAHMYSSASHQLDQIPSAAQT